MKDSKLFVIGLTFGLAIAMLVLMLCGILSAQTSSTLNVQSIRQCKICYYADKDLDEQINKILSVVDTVDFRVHVRKFLAIDITLEPRFRYGHHLPGYAYLWWMEVEDAN